jgi:2-polyprenyl-6-methoxyphenol hydroxylase-like FAD-dependent oxidoreductase
MGSRGKGLQPRTLEMFDDLGIVDVVLAHGVFNLPFRNYDESGQARDVSEIRLPKPAVPYPGSLIIAQWQVEAVLRQKLEQLGGRVEFGVELTGLTPDEEGVTASFSGLGTQTLRARWLVGCDGGKSTVRQLSNIPFLGETLETYRMLVGDVHVEGLDRDHWHVWKSPEGFLALCPLPSTEVFQFQSSVAPGQESETSLEVLQRHVDSRTSGSGLRLSNPTWMSLWRANVRMVQTYRQGRVFSF